MIDRAGKRVMWEGEGGGDGEDDKLSFYPCIFRAEGGIASCSVRPETLPSLVQAKEGNTAIYMES